MTIISAIELDRATLVRFFDNFLSQVKIFTRLAGANLIGAREFPRFPLRHRKQKPQIDYEQIFYADG